MEVPVTDIEERLKNSVKHMQIITEEYNEWNWKLIFQQIITKNS